MKRNARTPPLVLHRERSSYSASTYFSVRFYQMRDQIGDGVMDLRQTVTNLLMRLAVECLVGFLDLT